MYLPLNGDGLLLIKGSLFSFLLALFEPKFVPKTELLVLSKLVIQLVLF